MDNDSFYGTDRHDCVSYLEFGQIDLAAGKKTVWDFRLHQKAYDWLMLGRYANDMLAYCDMEAGLDTDSLGKVLGVFDAEVHHKGDFSTICAQLCALATVSGQSFFELGQTLFGCIDGMRFALKLFERLGIEFPAPDLAAVEWRGVDISGMFNKLAVRTHPDYKTRTNSSLDAFPEGSSVFFSKGITLHYAIRDPSQFVALISKSDISVFDYSLSLHERQESTVGTGKSLLYLAAEEMALELSKHPATLLVKSNSRFLSDTNRIWLECIYGDESVCRRYVDIHNTLRENLLLKLGSMDAAKRLLNDEHPTAWVTFDEYLRSIGHARGGRA